VTTRAAIKKVLANDEASPTQNAEILYDSNATQIIPLTLTKNGKDFRVSFTMKPLSNERYFAFELEVSKMNEKAKRVSTDLYIPKEKLWSDLVESRAGYKETPDWKTATRQTDAVAAIQAILHTQVLAENEIEQETDEELFDDDALTAIPFRALQSGVLITLTHSFRQETKAEMDEFLAIETDATNQNALASAVKLSKAEKLSILGRKLIRETEGYASGSEIPAWHLAATIETFFVRQMARMGKSLNP